ncbi:MAG: cytochrome ubiquinol oxidase subunit I [Sulfobacillus benefaciens]|uniref:Cytochrome ubiquinol oxidase subunit I n=1 Tax=Sulfobacillus benefaciens TaxID=453960 RepID=A0A2T2XCX5_9FIRM|nr:MAG: cytochrome ubiquinol oxidase subunit I [Sulfobacillus benefaciens]
MAEHSQPLAPRYEVPSISTRHGRLWSWLTSVDHKQLGRMYLVSSFIFFLLGGIEAFLMRIQLAVPNNHFVTAQMYNQLFTMHGITMLFLAVMPMTSGFMNYMVPLMIGARDVAFPRLNALSFWLFLFGGLMLYSSWFLGGAPNAGWWNYVPISGLLYNPGHGIDFYDIGLQIAGLGSIIGSINFLVTIINMRAPGMTMMRLPLFVWSTFVTSILILFALPPLSVLLWTNLFWIFGHPEVYILILPVFGIVSEILPTFARKPIFGYTAMVMATFVIGFLAFTVWVHHMFALGYGPVVNSIFGITSMLIAIPTGVKIFNWIATLWDGQLHLTTAVLWVLGFLVCFTIGGMSGVMLAVSPADLQYNNSYFVVAHFHYVLIGGSIFGLFAGLYYWFPKITGKLMNETLGKWNFWLMFIGFNVTFFPFHILGLLGMPRRIYTYAPGLGLTFWNQVSTFGVFILTAGLLVFIGNLLYSLGKQGQIAVADPWDGRTLEWAIASPPPVYNFEHIPLIRSRDALWAEKMYGDGTMLRAEETGHHVPEGMIHMPARTMLPAILAFGLFVAGYGFIFHIVWLDAIGLAITFATLLKSMFEVDRGALVPIETPKEVGIDG